MDTLNVFLRTPLALGVGQSHTNASEAFTVEVLQDIVGGYQVKITRSQDSSCPQLLTQINQLQILHDATTDNNIRRQLRVQLNQLRAKARNNGCL